MSVSTMPSTSETAARFVLLADIDDGTRRMYRDYFKASAIDIEEAADGREALAKAMTGRPDAIVTEAYLPGISGYALTQLLRTEAATKVTPIIFVTVEASVAAVDRARVAGTDAVLAKPCLPEVVLREMRRLIERSRELRSQAVTLKSRLASQLARSEQLHQRSAGHRGKPSCRTFWRHDTAMPPKPPPLLVCPECDRSLSYRRSHIGGVSERFAEQWDCYECPAGCGRYQYRQRTKKMRKVVEPRGV